MVVKSNFKKILDEKGLSINQVKEDTGYRYESLRKFYNDTTVQFHKELLNTLCEYLNVTPGELLKYEKDPSELE